MGSWKIIVSFEPRMRFSCAAAAPRMSAPSKRTLPAAHGIARQQSHGGHEHLSLAGARLADDADALAGRDGERYLRAPRQARAVPA